jgi:hypothetical protein
VSSLVCLYTSPVIEILLCLYTSPVIEILLCPSRSATALMCTPASSHPTAPGYRRVWTATPATLAVFAAASTTRSRFNTSVSAALGLIRYAKRIDDSVSATTAAELATARLDRDDLESVLRLIWPSMAELHTCFHLSQRRQAARDDAAFNELIARLDEEDGDSDG